MLSAGLGQTILPSLDGIRALAVMIVVFGHLGLPVNSGLGVTLFFVLSGFLITWLLLKEEGQYGTVSLGMFYVRRSLRIFPAFYVFWFLVVVGLGVMRSHPVDWANSFASLFYYDNYYQAITSKWSSPLFHTWSLSTEEQFYLLWPPAFLLLRNNQSREKLLMILIPCLWAYRLILVWVGVPQGYIYSALDTRADHLLIGCLFAVLMFERRGSKFWQAITGRGAFLAITLSMLALSSYLTGLLGPAFRDTVGFIADPLLAVALLAQGLSLQPGWLNVKPIRYLGRISYSIYLYHMLASAAAHWALSRFPAPVEFSGAIVTAVAAGFLSYYFIELPALSLKHRLPVRLPRKRFDLNTGSSGFAGVAGR